MDGEIDCDDRGQLTEKREQPGLAADDARQWLTKATLDSVAAQPAAGMLCPHCDKSID